MLLDIDNVMYEISDMYVRQGSDLRGMVESAVRDAYERGVRDGYNAVYDSAVREEIEQHLAYIDDVEARNNGR